LTPDMIGNFLHRLEKRDGVNQSVFEQGSQTPRMRGSIRGTGARMSRKPKQKKSRSRHFLGLTAVYFFKQTPQSSVATAMQRGHHPTVKHRIGRISSPHGPTSQKKRRKNARGPYLPSCWLFLLAPMTFLAAPYFGFSPALYDWASMTRSLLSRKRISFGKRK
jgi:hypothetical protein